MKAIVINDDKSLSWKEVPDPVVKDDEVLIEVHAAAINRADLLQREGSYPPPPGCPAWPGLEVAGIVRKTGKNVSRHQVGEKVCALLGGGGYAEYAAVSERMVLPMPNGLSFEEASAIPEVYATAYLNLFMVGQAKKGDTVLMFAGASGLGTAVIPMAKAFGLRVITTVRGEKRALEIAYLGADRVVNTLQEDIAEVLKQEAASGHPVDLVIDCLGGNRVNDCLKQVNRGCRWISIATLAGDISPVDFRNVYVKNIRIIGSTLRSKTPEQKGEVLGALVREVWPKFESGAMKVRIHGILPIERAEEAQGILYRNENIGKVVLKIR